MDHLDPEGLSPYDMVSSVWIEHPQFEATVAKVRKRLSLRGSTPPKGLPILGPSDWGKTTLFNKLAEEYPIREHARKTVLADGTEMVAHDVPLLALTMPDRPKAPDLMRDMLKAYGDPFYHKGTPYQLRDRLQRCWANCGTKAILIDEAQRAVDAAGEKTQEAVAEFLKEPYDKAGIPVILLGLSRARRLFDYDNQFDRRFSKEVVLTPYDWGKLDAKEPPGSRRTFVGLLHAFCDAGGIELSEQLDIGDEGTQLRFYYAGRGLTGRLKTLLEKAVELADGRRVDLRVLSAAYEESFRTDREVELAPLENPFAAGWTPSLPPPLPDDRLVRRRPAPFPSRKKDRDRVAKMILSP